MSIDDFIKWSIRNLEQTRKDNVIFFDYAKCKLEEWQLKLKAVNVSELLDCTKKQIVKSNKERSFYNLINYISQQYIEILKYTYQGNLFEAIMLLRNLLYIQKYTQYKLRDTYINYFKFIQFDKSTDFFRVVDFAQNEQPTNCNHVPFTKRQYAKHNRFNSFGYPCLYLSNNKDCCVNEIGELKAEEKRYYSKFKHKKNNAIYFNLIIPSDVSSMTDFEKFSFIITYPMLLLCLSPTINGSAYEEEYLFPQLLLPSLFLTNKPELSWYIGIAYNSTKDFNTMNLVIPAKLGHNEVMPQNDICEFISNKIAEDGPFELPK